MIWDDVLSSNELNEDDASKIKSLIQKFCSTSFDNTQSDKYINGHVLSLKDFLFKSICDGKTVTVKCIVESLKLLLNAQNELAQTPIVFAAEKGKEDIVEMLAKRATRYFYCLKR